MFEERDFLKINVVRYSCSLRDVCVVSAHLTGPKDDPVIVLRPVLFMIVQLLSPKTHGDRPERLVHSQIVPVLYKRGRTIYTVHIILTAEVRIDLSMQDVACKQILSWN